MANHRSSITIDIPPSIGSRYVPPAVAAVKSRVRRLAFSEARWYNAAMEQKAPNYRPMMPLDDERKRAYLECLAATGSTMAASQAGSPHCKSGYMTFADEIRRSPAFARDVENAKSAYREVVLAALHERAITGWDEPQFSAKTGKQMVDSENRPAVKRVFSDKALELALRRRSIWGDEFATQARVETKGTITHENTAPRLDLTEAEIFRLPAQDRRDLARILRQVASMRNEPSMEEVDRQAAQLIEYQEVEATAEAVENDNSQIEEWERL